MPNSFFQFKEFFIEQGRSAMKVSTDACLLGAWAPVPQQGHFLDIGTGTGLLALMLAQRSQGSIDAVDLDEESIEEASENIAKSKWSKRIKTFHIDIKKFAPGYSYDLIISNPPFYQNHLKSPFPGINKAKHADYLSPEELIIAVSHLMKPEGSSVILLPNNSTEELLMIAERHQLFHTQRLLIRDKPSSEIIRSIHVLNRSKAGLQEEVLDIRNQDGSYSGQFVELLKPFYLNL